MPTADDLFPNQSRLEIGRASAWGLLTCSFALLLSAAPVAPQSPSLVAQYALTEVDVTNAPLTAQTADHQISTHGFINFSHDWQAPDLKVCAEESVKAGYPHPASCSQTCYYEHDCKAVLTPPLALSSPTAAVQVEIEEPDMSGAAFYAAKFIVNNIGNFVSTAYMINSQGGFQATFVISTDHKKAVGLAKSAVQAAKKIIQEGKIPLPPLISLGDVREGAQNAYNQSVQNYNMCLNAKASQYQLVTQAERCQGYKNSDYSSCMADVLANADHQDVVVAYAPAGCADRVGQSVIDTKTEIVKAALCRWINYGAALFGTQACTPAAPISAGTPPYSPFQYCLMGAIESMDELDPAGPNLTAQASQRCNAAQARTQGAWESCMYSVLTGPTNAQELSQMTQAQYYSAAEVRKRNFYREAGMRAGICLNVRAKQDPKWNPTQ